jgi:hypothetical protein
MEDAGDQFLHGWMLIGLGYGPELPSRSRKTGNGSETVLAGPPFPPLP